MNLNTNIDTALCINKSNYFDNFNSHKLLAAFTNVELMYILDFSSPHFGLWNNPGDSVFYNKFNSVVSV